MMKLSMMGSNGRWMVVLGWLDPSVGMVTAIMLKGIGTQNRSRDGSRDED